MGEAILYSICTVLFSRLHDFGPSVLGMYVFGALIMAIPLC